MIGLYAIIDMVRVRPAIYIGDLTLSTMASYLEGLRFALKVNEINEYPAFSQFHSWLEQRFTLEPSSRGYKTIILNHCNNEEEKALLMFFELLDEYRMKLSE